NGILGRSGDGGTALSAELDEPNSICMTGDKLYISDWGNDYVRIIDFNANNSGFMSNIDINFIEQSGENTLAVPNLGSNTYITLLDSRKHLIFVKKLKDRRVTLRGIYKGKYKVIISDKGKFAGSKTIEIK
ncbi:MAG: hypothetical protein EBX41_02255, partial [Chitinophagia bacterium]|nr:hypothetical protein [Chitinophagia bacterium]